MTWLTVNYVLVALPIGIIIGEALISRPISTNTLASYKRSTVVSMLHSTMLSWLILVTLLAISILFTGFTFVNMKSNPILSLFLGASSSELDKARYYADASSGVLARIIIINKMLSPIIFLGCYANNKVFRKKVTNLITILALINAVFCLFYKLEKASLPVLAISFLMLESYTNALKKGTIIKLGTVIVIWLIMMFFLTRGIDNFAELFSLRNGLLGRILVQQIQGLTVHFTVFPQQHNFMGFSNILGHTIATALGLSYEASSSRITNEIAFGSRVASDTYGVMNTLFAGEAYAAFGYIGLLLSPLVVGMKIGFQYALFLNLPKNALFLAAFAFFSANTFITGGFGYFLYNPDKILLLVLVGIVYTYGLALDIATSTTGEEKQIVCKKEL